MLALGLAGVLWCVRVMRDQTGVDGIMVGHRFVTTGPYRFVRHAMYAAVLVFAFGSALVFGSYGIATVALVFLPVAISWAATEERLLPSSADLGAEYATTCGAPVGWCRGSDAVHCCFGSPSCPFVPRSCGDSSTLHLPSRFSRQRP